MLSSDASYIRCLRTYLMGKVSYAAYVVDETEYTDPQSKARFAA